MHDNICFWAHRTLVSPVVLCHASNSCSVVYVAAFRRGCCVLQLQMQRPWSAEHSAGLAAALRGAALLCTTVPQAMPQV